VKHAKHQLHLPCDRHDLTGLAAAVVFTYTSGKVGAVLLQDPPLHPRPSLGQSAAQPSAQAPQALPENMLADSLSTALQHSSQPAGKQQTHFTVAGQGHEQSRPQAVM